MTSINDPKAPRDLQVLSGELQMLRAALTRPEVTIDDASTPEQFATSFQDGGKWRGSIPKRLVADGILHRIVDEDGRLCVARSRRSARHGGTIGVYRLANLSAANQRVEAIVALLSGFGESLTQQYLFPLV